MSAIRPLITVGALALLSAAPAMAQQNDPATAPDTGTAASSTSSARAATPDSTKAPAILNVFRKTVQGVRPYDARGINVFETPKPDTEAYTGPSLDIGAAFTQAFQSLDH